MELVTEPVIHDAKKAGEFARELQLLLRSIDISDANMEKGEMRVEVNLSVSKNSDIMGTKVEVKNINSFRSVEGAITYEVERQIRLLESGGEVVQETRGWDESKLATFSQRKKETAKDYRYFPDPDIPKIRTSSYKQFNASLLSEIMPLLPNNKRVFYQNLGLPNETIEQIITEIQLDFFLIKVLDIHTPVNPEIARLAANYLLSDVTPLLQSLSLADLKPESFAELMQMLSVSEINSRVAKDLLPELFSSSESPRQIAITRNLLQISDASVLFKVVAAIISANPSVVSEYKAGKESAIQFFVGQGMKATRGSANPQVLLEVIKSALETA
jgi:aspartyl-tRNA(Asn)/glutamyl-tRNA(Gln) amidotransferase subunit B